MTLKLDPDTLWMMPSTTDARIMILLDLVSSGASKWPDLVNGLKERAKIGRSTASDLIKQALEERIIARKGDQYYAPRSPWTEGLDATGPIQESNESNSGVGLDLNTCKQTLNGHGGGGRPASEHPPESSVHPPIRGWTDGGLDRNGHPDTRSDDPWWRQQEYEEEPWWKQQDV